MRAAGRFRPVSTYDWRSSAVVLLSKHCITEVMRLTGVITPSASAATARTAAPNIRVQHPLAHQRLRCCQYTCLQLLPKRQQHTAALPARHNTACKRAPRFSVYASAASAAQPEDTPSRAQGPLDKFKALLSPFSEPSTNKKLLALCGAQALSSVATLIHDTYLPLYLSEELKLSNTKVVYL